MQVPALYRVRIEHARVERVRHAFRYSHYLWFVDLDDLPELPRPLRWLARFRARDHVGDADLSLRENIDAYLAEHGLDLTGGRVLMLGAAAVGGYVFNPLTVFWCLDADGRHVCTVAEVHNTYGGRHRYLLHPDDRDRAQTDKAFYVSPFFAVDGRYELRLPVPTESLHAAIRLYRDDTLAFVATMSGTRSPATTGQLLRELLRHPFPTLRVSALIRFEGIRLWRRGVPVVGREPASTAGNGHRPESTRDRTRENQEHPA